MAEASYSLDFVKSLLAVEKMPRLSDGEISRLRNELSVLDSTSNKTPPEGLRRLLIVLRFNENLRVVERQKTPVASCDDAEVLLSFAREVAILTAAIDTLNEEGVGPQDTALYWVRDFVILTAVVLRKRVETVRGAMERQDMLAGERRNVLANLSQSLDFMAHGLRSSMMRGWGYRITKEAAPPEVVKEWDGHWRNVRRTAIDMNHWAIRMADGRSQADQYSVDGDSENLASPTQCDADPKAPYMPAGWFKDEFGLTAESLRGQARRGNLAITKRGHWNQYSVPDAMAIWPQLVTYGPNESK